MADVLRINLGCGSTYKPGYLNIDKFDKSAADLLADASFLPCLSESVDAIEATQLIEHFDLVNLRYVLAEWFRILKPGADLVIETPDLSRSFKKLLRSKDEQRRMTLQWIFGIDSPGLQHRSGFTFEHLKQELALSGFCEIVRETELTHTYEPGMRVKCRKRLKPDGEMFFAGFRSRLRAAIGAQGSYVLIPLESWIDKVRSSPGAITTRKGLHELISALAPCNPMVAVAFLEEVVASKAFSENEVSEESRLLKELVRMRFHERAFELWIRSRKGNDVDGEFASFITRLRSSIQDSLENPENFGDRMGYIVTLAPRSIPLLDLNIVLQEAQKSFSAGLKAFHENDLDGAEMRFAESLSINPCNPLACWNRARLSILSGRNSEIVIGHYRDAIGTAPNIGLRRRVESELSLFSEGNARIDEMVPISTF